MDRIFEDRARVFKALADPRRLQILELLHSGEKCACVLLEQMEMPQSSLSYHMKILCESGIVEGRCAGKWTHYRISPFGSQIALALLQQMLSPEDGAECDCCRDSDRPWQEERT